MIDGSTNLYFKSDWLFCLYSISVWGSEVAYWTISEGGVMVLRKNPLLIC